VRSSINQWSGVSESGRELQFGRYELLLSEADIRGMGIVREPSWGPLPEDW
jgi:hypothetical protein